MERRTSGGSLNTFVMGILVGVALTLLLTTKKGRKLLKLLTEEGADRISKWEDMLQKAQEEAIEEDLEEEEIVESEEYVEPAERQVEETQPEEETAPQKTFEKIEPVIAPEEKETAPVRKEKEEKVEQEKEAKEEKPKSPRRFFRGARKK